MTLLMIPRVRTTIEDRVMIFLSYGLGIVIKKWQVFFKKWVWQALYINCGELFSHNLRISSVGYKIKNENHNLHIFKT